MPPEPDLTAELDGAEDIVTGRVEAVEVERGVRYGPGVVGLHGAGADKEHWARLEAASEPGALVRCTVTYGPWEEVPPDVCPKCGTAGCLEDKALDF